MSRPAPSRRRTIRRDEGIGDLPGQASTLDTLAHQAEPQARGGGETVATRTQRATSNGEDQDAAHRPGEFGSHNAPLSSPC